MKYGQIDKITDFNNNAIYTVTIFENDRLIIKQDFNDISGAKVFCMLYADKYQINCEE